MTQDEIERANFLAFADLLDICFPATYEHEKPGGENIRVLLADRDSLVSDLQATRAELETARAKVERLRTREFTMEDFERINERVLDLVTALPHMANEVRIQTWIDSVNEWLRGGEA